MGPKSAAASLPSRNLSWLDRMYMKVENICAEVDKHPSILLQDTSKFVEAQMKVVGVNVKKLCNDIIQDLLPPPILSSEVAEKKAECAVHCKCDCIQFEKPKHKDVDDTMEIASTKASSRDVQAKGSEDWKGTIKESALGKQNISTRDDTKVDMRSIDFTSENLESRQFQGDYQTLSGEGNKQFPGCDEMGHGVKEGSKHVSEHVEAKQVVKQSAAAVAKHSTGSLEEQLQQIGKEQRNFSSEVKAPTQREEREMSVQEEIMLVTVQRSGCEEPAVPASAYNMRGEREELEGHGSLIIEGERKELVRDSPFNIEGAREDLVIHGHFVVGMMKNVADRSTVIDETTALDLKDAKQAAEASSVMHASDDDDDAQNTNDVEIPSFGMLDADSQYARLLGSMNAIEVVGAEDSRNGDLRFMYSYVFHENSRSSQDSMTVSEYLHEEYHLHEEDDGEQSARWLVEEDLRDMIRPENFSADVPSDKTESSPKELDLEWELL